MSALLSLKALVKKRTHYVILEKRLEWGGGGDPPWDLDPIEFRSKEFSPPGGEFRAKGTEPKQVKGRNEAVRPLIELFVHRLFAPNYNYCCVFRCSLERFSPFLPSFPVIDISFDYREIVSSFFTARFAPLPLRFGLSTL